MRPSERPAPGPASLPFGPGTGRPDFTAPVPQGGYAWWYLDALSDDGRHGLTIIGFIGSVFSPWYAWARRRGPADPADHCAMNVALYGAPTRWAMTERTRHALTRTPDTLTIGPSHMAWRDGALTVAIAETTAPLPGRLAGTIRLTPEAIATQVTALDPAGHHHWSPIAPRARVDIAFTAPRLAWQGEAYFDCNWGDRPLEADFAGWHWCRAPVPEGGAAVQYYVRPRNAPPRIIALRYGADGACAPFMPPPEHRLPATFWRLPRSVGCEPGSTPSVVRDFVDAPFYARSEIRTRMLGRDMTAMHEELSLDRFDTPWMRLMLPFRAPRLARRPAAPR